MFFSRFFFFRFYLSFSLVQKVLTNSFPWTQTYCFAKTSQCITSHRDSQTSQTPQPARQTERQTSRSAHHPRQPDSQKDRQLDSQITRQPACHPAIYPASHPGHPTTPASQRVRKTDSQTVKNQTASLPESQIPRCQLARQANPPPYKF